MQVSSIDADGLLPIAIEEIHTVPLTTCPVEDPVVVTQLDSMQFVGSYVSMCRRRARGRGGGRRCSCSCICHQELWAILDELVMKLIA